MSGEPTGAISDGVVEAAAKALHDWIGCPPGWDELDEHARSILRGGAIRILAAALPHIRSALADDLANAAIARVARGGPLDA